MRKIIIEVPEKTCAGCHLIKSSITSWRWSCALRKRPHANSGSITTFLDTEPCNSRPVKACRDATHIIGKPKNAKN